MRRADRHAIEELGIPARLLMENAGRAVARALIERLPHAVRPFVLCGAGNNGGDGFVAARVLRAWDPRVRPVVRVWGERARMTEEARANLDLLVHGGLEVGFHAGKDDIESLASQADVVVDGVFGVGLARPVTGELAEVFAAISELPVPVVSIDIPSGLSSDTGEPLGSELRADLVVTLGLPKLGLAVRPLPGELRVADIGLPHESVQAAGIRQWVPTREAVVRRLPPRPLGAHKGSFGHVLVVAGSPGKTGAACLAAEGAVRGGAGLVTAAAPAALRFVFEEKLTEAMKLGVGSPSEEWFGEEMAETLEREAAARDALALGPGLGTRPETARLVERLLGSLRTPAVVDADALNAFSGRPEALRGPGPRILTPHPGEMGRLLGRTAEEVQADRVGCARALARKARAVVVLKGARTIVCAPDGDLFVNPTGGPGLATGGTGDVLTGLLGALLAQRCDPLDAALAGVYLHGLAGDALGPFGATAGDVAATLGRAWRKLLCEEPAHERGDLRRFP
jgi:NAD(P)H-hydrate epimerase